MTQVGRICRRCVMDESDPDITFDEHGHCVHCRRAAQMVERLPASEPEAAERFARVVRRIEGTARSAEYQCLLGLSGGVDSSYVGWLAGRSGLRVLAVHFDNGWNSEVAVGNIERLCEHFGFELMTYVIRWEEFRDLQRSFLEASVVDVELVTDHAIFAAMLQLARENRIRFVLSGTNFATESILPRAWIWPKQDRRNIEAIHKRFGSVPLKTYPRCGPVRWGLMRATNLGGTYVELLNEVRYRRGEAKQTLARELGWADYGGKHHESLFTKFYQCYLLPQKFGIDKRKAHLSSLIMNGEVTRDDALGVLASPPYPPDELAEELPYVLKKLGYSSGEFDAIMARPPVPHDHYPSSRLLPILRRAGVIQRSSRDVAT